MPDSKPKDKLNRLLSTSTAQFNSAALAANDGSVDYSPDALYNRFMMVYADLKGHYASGFGDYGVSRCFI